LLLTTEAGGGALGGGLMLPMSLFVGWDFELDDVVFN